MELGKIKLEQYSNDKVSIYQVNGFYIRNQVDINFTEGGHDYLYEWIPKGEIWLDNVNKIEHSFIALHELAERRLMSGGMDYDEAHEKANISEKQSSDNPESVMDLIKQGLDSQP